MSRDISDSTRREVYSSQTPAVFLVLLDISHPDLAETIRVVNNNQSIVSNGNTYTATAFQFSPPEDQEETVGTAKLTIDNVDRMIVTAVRSISSAPTVSARVIIADTPDVTEQGPWEFQLTNVTYSAMSVSGDLVFQSYLQEIAGTSRYTSLSTPCLI